MMDLALPFAGRSASSCEAGGLPGGCVTHLVCRCVRTWMSLQAAVLSCPPSPLLGLPGFRLLISSPVCRDAQTSVLAPGPCHCLVTGDSGACPFQHLLFFLFEGRDLLLRVVQLAPSTPLHRAAGSFGFSYSFEIVNLSPHLGYKTSGGYS